MKPADSALASRILRMETAVHALMVITIFLRAAFASAILLAQRKPFAIRPMENASARRDSLEPDAIVSVLNSR